MSNDHSIEGIAVTRYEMFWRRRDDVRLTYFGNVRSEPYSPRIKSNFLVVGGGRVRVGGWGPGTQNLLTPERTDMSKTELSGAIDNVKVTSQDEENIPLGQHWFRDECYG